MALLRVSVCLLFAPGLECGDTGDLVGLIGCFWATMAYFRANARRTECWALPGSVAPGHQTTITHMMDRRCTDA